MVLFPFYSYVAPVIQHYHTLNIMFKNSYSHADGELLCGGVFAVRRGRRHLGVHQGHGDGGWSLTGHRLLTL